MRNVNVVSVAGAIAYGPSGPYAAAKHAQLAFSRSVSVELAARRVRVHAVCPGPVETGGFPQERLRRTRWGRRLVIAPERAAEAILRALERDRPETFVPAGFRLAVLVAELAPSTLGRLAARRRASP